MLMIMMVKFLHVFIATENIPSALFQQNSTTKVANIFCGQNVCNIHAGQLSLAIPRRVEKQVPA